MHLIRHKQVAFAALNNALRLHLHFIYRPMKIILSKQLTQADILIFLHKGNYLIQPNYKNPHCYYSSKPAISLYP